MARARTRTAKPTRTRPRGSGRFTRGLAALGNALFLRVLAMLAPLGRLIARAAVSIWRSGSARRLAAVGAGLALLAALAWGMQAQLRQSPRYVIDPGRIELTAVPSWAQPALAARVRADIERGLRTELAQLAASDAFDTALPERIAAALRRSPWVQDVRRIDRRFPVDADAHARLMPELEVRRPVLLVESGLRYVVVDGQGVVLPLGLSTDMVELADFQQQLLMPLRVVKGVTATPPAPGLRWSNEQIAAALSMEQVLRKSEIDRGLPIESIELVGVPEQPNAQGRVHYPADGGVKLWPDQRRFAGGCWIWGRPPVHASTLEATPNEKLAKLQQWLQRPPQDLVGLQIDLRRRVS